MENPQPVVGDDLQDRLNSAWGRNLLPGVNLCKLPQ